MDRHGEPVVTGREFTPDEITEGIAQAIHDRQFDVVPGLIGLLAIQDPKRAQDVLDTFDLAKVIADARQS